MTFGWWRAIGSIGLLGRIFIILALVLATEFVANTYIFDRASQFALREDEARRMAEHLVVARRVLDRTPSDQREGTAHELSTQHFSIAWSPGQESTFSSFALRNLQTQIMTLEPELRRSTLRLHLRPLREGGDIAGSMELSDHSVMAFTSAQADQIWSLTFGRVLTWVAPTLVLVLVGGLMLRVTLRPFRTLMRATREVGMGDPEPVREQGPAEIRALIHAFNVMQQRIHRLITSRTQALAAVGHDLRTPLARLQLRLDGLRIEPEAHQALSQDIEEMTDLLQSLQIYLSGEAATVPRERIDLAAMAQTLIDSACDMGQDAVYIGPESLEISVRPVPIRRSLANLVDNSLHYGGNVRLSLTEETDTVTIVIDDDGPGIAPDRLTDVVQPFVRLDDARSRNTRGMGLGLSIVSDAVRAEGGSFALENRDEGGLRAIITLPHSLC